MEYIDAGFFFQNIPLKFSNIKHIDRNLYGGTVIADMIRKQQRAKVTEYKFSFTINQYHK